MATITEIPFETWDHILGYNNHKDTKNMACCSRDLYTLLKPMIWKKVSIVYPKCRGSLKRDDEYLGNLGHTEDLNFASLPEVCRTPRDVSRFAQYTLHWGKLLGFFKLGKLRSLTIRGAPEVSCFSFTIESLYYIRILRLNNVNIGDWTSLGCLRKLELIEVSQCNINDDIFKALVNSNKSKTVAAIRCNFLTSRCLEFIDDALIIKEFTFFYNGLDQVSYPTLNAGHFNCLKKVSYLSLARISLSDESLTWICENLNAVEVLNLSQISGISDEGFQSIHSLTSLRTLDIEHCDELSDRIFAHIGASTSIRSLNFDANLCKQEDVTHVERSNLSSTLKMLCKDQNLREITIRVSNVLDARGRRVAIEPSTGFDRAHDGLLTYIIEVLCGNANWSLKTICGSTLRVYSFSRC